MKHKITVFIENNKKELYLEACLVKPEISMVTLKNVTVYWKFKNITSETEITFGSGSSTNITLEPGYWPFEMIKERLGSDNVALEALRHNNKCRIKPNGGSL